MPPFIHLHLHTEYSMSDGLLTSLGCVEQAVNFAMPAVAITDVNNLFGALKFYFAARKQGVKPIIGCELSVDENPGARVIVLCMNTQGYFNLCNILTFMYQRRTSQPASPRQSLQKWNDGLIILAGGITGDLGLNVLEGNQQKLAERVDFWTKNFPNRFYLEVQAIGLDPTNEKRHATKTIQLAHSTGLPLVATNAVQFLNPEDFETHEAKVCIASGDTLKNPQRPVLFSNEQYFKSTEQMHELFASIPSAIENTYEIAKRCSLEFAINTPHLPLYPTQGKESTNELIKNKTHHALASKTLTKDVYPKYEKRLAYELKVIKKMGFTDYFLIVANFVQWAKKEKIPVGPGRGSGAGSLVAYLLDITEIDPFDYDLLFERFLNTERITLPDFDIDFCIKGRDRVIQYVIDKYGQDRVCKIITFGSLGAKAAIRDVGRVLGHPYLFVDGIARLIPAQLNVKLEEALEKSSQLRSRYEKEQGVRTIMDMAMKLEGLARNPGRHAGGVVITPKPLVHYTALYSDSNSQELTTHWDMKDLEKTGLIKFDLLGLKTLTVLNKAQHLLAKQYSEKIDLRKVPLDDTKTYALLQTGETSALFQLESDGMQALIREMRPDKFDDIVALVALYRPGPLNAGMADIYVAGKSGKRIHYDHPNLENILGSTYGTILYQEQVMQIARVIAGYTLGQADMLRHAMGKKVAKEMEGHSQMFIDGCCKHGVKMHIAKKIFRLIQHFGGYGFNKSHSVCYALIAYQTAWMKTNYPTFFLAAIMCADMDDNDKIVQLVFECRRMGIEVLPPDVNLSSPGFNVEAKGIRFGLCAIRQIGRHQADAITQEREANGKYKSFFDFCFRVGIKLGRSNIETLVFASSFGSVTQEQVHLCQCFHQIFDAAKKSKEERSLNMGYLQPDEEPPPPEDFSAFEHLLGRGRSSPLNQLTFSQRLQALAHERDAVGMYLRSHPATLWHQTFAPLSFTSVATLQRVAANAANKRGGKEYSLLGTITEIKSFEDRYSTMIQFFLEDESGKIKMRHLKKTGGRNASLWKNGDCISVKTKFIHPILGRRMGTWKAMSIISIEELMRYNAKCLCLEITKPLDNRDIHDFQTILQASNTTTLTSLKDAPRIPSTNISDTSSITKQESDNKISVFVEYTTSGLQGRIQLGDKWKVVASQRLLDNLIQCASVKGAKFLYPSNGAG